MRVAAVGFVVLVGVLVSGCTNTAATGPAAPTTRSGSTAHSVVGRVVDHRTGNPLAGAAIVAGPARTVTDSNGTFTLSSAEPSGHSIVVTAKNYRAATAQVPTAASYNITIALTPIPTTVTIRSNLTRTAIHGTVSAGSTSTRTTGSVRVWGVGPGDTVRASSPGYEAANAKIANNRRGVVTLEAGPQVTAEYLARVQIQQNYRAEIALIHPNVLRYVSAANIATQLRKSDSDGYSLIRLSVKSVTMLPRWRFPGCNGAGVRTYKHVAAVEYTDLSSAPNGGSQSRHGIEHLVRVPATGTWDWFPIVVGCE